MINWTPEELAEMAAADAELDALPVTNEEAAEVDRRDRQIKLHRKDNKAFKLAETQRRYYEANKDKVAETRRRYYEANKDKVADFSAGTERPTRIRWRTISAGTERPTREREAAMTLQQIIESDKHFLMPTDVAEVLGCKPYSINCQAKEDPEKLGFAVCIMGSTVRIPRLAFLHWLSFGNAPMQQAER